MCGLVSKLDIDISTDKRRGKLLPRGQMYQHKFTWTTRGEWWYFNYSIRNQSI